MMPMVPSLPTVRANSSAALILIPNRCATLSLAKPPSRKSSRLSSGTPSRSATLAGTLLRVRDSMSAMGTPVRSEISIRLV